MNQMARMATNNDTGVPMWVSNYKIASDVNSNHFALNLVSFPSEFWVDDLESVRRVRRTLENIKSDPEQWYNIFVVNVSLFIFRWFRFDLIMDMWHAKKARPPKYDMSVQREIAQVQVNLRQLNLSFIGTNSTKMFSGKATLFHCWWNFTCCYQRRCWCWRLLPHCCSNQPQYTSKIHLKTYNGWLELTFGFSFFSFFFSYTESLTITWSTQLNWKSQMILLQQLCRFHF